MSDPPVETCEVCAAGPVEKVLFPVAVHFKGKGFYSTDYGKGSRSGGAKDGDAGGQGKESSSGDAASGSGAEKKSGGGTDSSTKSASD